MYNTHSWTTQICKYGFVSSGSANIRPECGSLQIVWHNLAHPKPSNKPCGPRTPPHDSTCPDYPLLHKVMWQRAEISLRCCYLILSLKKKNTHLLILHWDEQLNTFYIDLVTQSKPHHLRPRSKIQRLRDVLALVLATWSQLVYWLYEICRYRLSME